MTTPDFSFDAPPELLEAVGKIAGNWAALEVVLDMMAAICFHKGGGSQFTNNIPMGLMQKTKLIKKCLDTSAALATHKDGGYGLISRINSLSEDRNFILHGMLWSHKPDEQGRYEFRKFEFGQSKLALVNKRLTPSQIIDIAKAIAQLRDETLSFLAEIGDSSFNLWINQTTP